MHMTQLAACLAIGLLPALSGCTADEPMEPGASPSSAQADSSTPQAATTRNAEQFTGTLEGGIMAIGGETTGWRLIGEGETGQLEVDVSAVADEAARLRGQRVTITGQIETREYVERGKVPVLRASRITAALEQRD